MTSDQFPMIPPQMNILNVLFPVLMHFYTCLPLKTLFGLEFDSHPTKCDVIND